MDQYFIEGTQETPTINFDLLKGELVVSGNSIPENPAKFYNPLISALDVYASAPKPITTVTFKMVYINTSSSKHILDVLKKLEIINRNGSAVTVNWMYEDDDQDMEEAGNDYQSVVELTFKMHPVKV